MLLIVPAAFILTVIGTLVFRFCATMRLLGIPAPARYAPLNPDYYAPMVNLVREGDIDPGAFQEYLDSLTLDYRYLLGAIRQTMVQSDVDRPDLANSLLRHQIVFARALCRIELRIRLCSIGIGRLAALKAELLALKGIVDVLRPQPAFLTESAVWGD